VFDRLPGDTTSAEHPALTGKGVNRSSPGRTAMAGVLNRLNTAQEAWGWAATTSGAGTDSVTWSSTWGDDSLIPGENFVCAVPLEALAATTNNLGLGSPFTGNVEVCPVYRVGFAPGLGGAVSLSVQATKLPTIVCGTLVLGTVAGKQRSAYRAELVDIGGRKVMDLAPGANDVRGLAPGVYFVRGPRTEDGRPATAVKKIVVAR